MAAAHGNPSVLLIEPHGSFDLTYPLGLAYLAGYLRRAQVAVQGIDLRIEPRSSLIRTLQQGRFDIVGIRVLSTSVREAAEVAATVRRLLPRATLVVGGPHATLAPADAIDRVGADAAIRGDGEVPLLELLRGESHAAGVMRRGESHAELYVHQDLGDLDFADRTTFPVDRYYRQGSFGCLRRTAMIATRGCFRRCGYCSASALSGASFRKRHPESIIEEIARLRTEEGVRGVVFEDDNLLLDSDWARGLFSAIAQHAPGLVVDLPNGVNPELVDEPTIDLMADAGVRSIAFGLESLCRDNLRAIDRLYDPGHFERLASYARKRGIITTGYFLFGLPYDTTASVISQMMPIRRLPLDMAHVSVFRRLPGQPLQSGGSPLGETGLRLLRAAFYAMYYGDPSRASAILSRAGGGPGQAGGLVLRGMRWLRG